MTQAPDPATVDLMPGEAMHRKGEEGAQRAKRWFDLTTRTRSTWTNQDEVRAAQMEFTWPKGGHNPFSFDVGGILYGDPFDQHTFLAEVKNYSGDGQGNDFDDFLAKCYLVQRDYSRWANQFMYLTWHPFRVKNWTKLCGAEQIVEGCVRNRLRLFGEPNEDLAREQTDASICEALADRLWLIVLSEKQEDLLMSDEDRALIFQDRVMKGLV